MGQPLRAVLDAIEERDAELFLAAFEASSEGFALAESGRIVFANEAFSRLLNVQHPSELQGRPLASLRPPGHPCAFSAGLHACRESSNSHVCQFSSLHEDGSVSRIESSCTAFEKYGRKLLALTVRDVSVRERRRVVRNEDRRFRVIFDGAPTGIVQCDMEGRVLETNPAMERMLGYTREELRSKCLRELMHPDDAEKEQELFQQLAEGKRTSYELELRYRGRDSATGWVRLNVSLVRGVDGKPQFAIGMTEDITERKRAEQRLREAQKMEVIGRLVGGVAHDFNNLLTGITLYCDLLLAGLEKGSRLHHHAEEIHMASEQGAALIQQLMAISRQQVIEPRILCLNDVISKTRNLLARLLGEKFELFTQFEDPLGYVKMDPAQVQQILFNLVLNARDAMNQGGRILVETRNCELSRPGIASGRTPAVCLSVTDTGCGMDADTLSHLFEPFFTTKANGRGTGLGLATVYNIVRKSGGTVEVNSEPSRGTTIRVSLPRVAAPAEAREVEAAHSPKSAHETILLVEDNVAVRQAAYRILSECGYEVLEAGTGAAAVAMSREFAGPIHLLLADVVMPGMSGRELARQLAMERPELKVLYMSGYEPAPEGNVEESDPVVSFRKPFTGAALLEKSREILDGGSRESSKKSGKRKREKSCQ